MPTFRYKEKFDTQKRIEELQRRILQINAELERSTARKKVKRRGIAENATPWSFDENCRCILNLNFFEQIKDPVILEAITKDLEQPSFPKIMDALSKSLDCHSSEICLIREDRTTRLGKKVTAIFFNFTYNPEFNEVLKETGDAYFDKSTKTWRVVATDANRSTVGDEADGFFRFVIDLTAMKVFLNPTDPEFSARPEAQFAPLDSYVNFNKSEILSAIRSSRPTDEFVTDQIFISTNTDFIKFNDTDRLKTKSPILLFRAQVSSGVLRYFLYSTNDRVVLDVAFGNKGNKSNSWIGQVRDTFKEIGIESFEVVS